MGFWLIFRNWEIIRMKAVRFMGSIPRISKGPEVWRNKINTFPEETFDKNLEKKSENVKGKGRENLRR